MPRRTKKSEVRLEVRRQWLRRLEENGESPPEIARADGYDVRTVRKHVDLARQEREVREARSVVIRQALEKHYHDLVTLAANLDKDVASAFLPEDVKNVRLWRALRQHLPRSPLWKAFDKIERLGEEEKSTRKRAEDRQREECQRTSPVGFAQKAGGIGLHSAGLVGAIEYHLRAEPGSGLQKIHTSSVEGGLVQVIYGEWICALVPVEQVRGVKGFISNLMATVESWPEAEDLRRVLADRRRAIDLIRDELAVITLRRVLPGRCTYCPI